MNDQTIILLIDDDEDDRDFFEYALKEIDEKIKFVGAPNAMRGLDEIFINNLIPTYIFLDLNMPIMGGKECLTNLKNNQKSANIPVMIFSTSADPIEIKEMKELGALGFLSKPSKTSELTKILRNFIDNQSNTSN